MKKLYWTRTLKLFALAIPLILFVMLGQTILGVRGSKDTVRLRGFYEEPEHSLDVVLLGASDVFFGYSPAYAYDLFGYTSYMYTTSSAPGDLYPYFLQEVLNHQDPQLIVVEVHGYLHDDDYMTKEKAWRYFSESVPLSMNKINAILNNETEDSKLSYFIPFGKYHGEWKNFSEIKENRRYREEIFGHSTILKGAVTSARHDPVNPAYDVQSDFSEKELDAKTYESLMEFIDFCKQKNLDNVVFVRFPHRITAEEEYGYFQRVNAIEKIVTQHEFRFINLERNVDDIGIDYVNDFCDDDHLDADGQKKFTEYLGKLIREEYVIEPLEQTPENKAQWDLSAQYVPLFWEKARQMVLENNFDLVFESPEIMEDLTRSFEELNDDAA